LATGDELELAKDGLHGTSIYASWIDVITRMPQQEVIYKSFEAIPHHTKEIPGLYANGKTEHIVISWIT